MDRGYSLAHLILASVLVLTPLMAVVDAQAQIAFVSKRDGNPEIYVMDADGKNQRRLILPIIAMMTGLPHGRPTVNGLHSSPIGMVTLKTVYPLMKST